MPRSRKSTKSSRKRKVKSKRKKSGRKKTSRKRSLDCIRRSPRKPRAIQRRVIEYIHKDDPAYNGLLIVHGTGCGKTTAAAIASQCFLDRYPNEKVVFIGPAGLISNFRDELSIVQPEGEEKHMEKYEFYSFDAFLNRQKAGNPVDCEGAMLIIDEVHNLRNYTGFKANAALRCAKKARKRLLLTATPFVNNARDLIVPINMIYGADIAGPSKSFPFRITKSVNQNTINGQETVENLVQLLKGRVDYVPSCRGSKDFPKLVEKYIGVPMSEEYKKAYQAAVGDMAQDAMDIPNIVYFSNPKTFFHAYRKAVNRAGVDAYYGKKLDAAMKLIRTKKGKLRKSVVYTNWIDFGVNALSKKLREEGIDFRVYRGGLSAATKDKIIRDFNANKFPILIMTRAGGEGLDLKGVRNILVFDPVWNDAGINQIIGRAVRYRSHEALPKNQRKVTASKLLLTFPGEKVPLGSKNAPLTGDQMLYKYVTTKASQGREIDSILRNSSINRNIKPDIIEFNDPRENYKFYDLQDLKSFSLAKLKKICRALGMRKNDLGKSLSSFRAADKPDLAKKIRNFLDEE